MNNTASTDDRAKWRTPNGARDALEHILCNAGEVAEQVWEPGFPRVERIEGRGWGILTAPDRWVAKRAVSRISTRSRSYEIG
jgi:hypothetical protein